MNSVWKGFECFNEFPIFILTEENNGIFINPPTSEIANSEQITSSLLGGPNLYRNEDILESTKDYLADSPIFWGYLEYPDHTIFVYHLSEIADNFYNNYKNRNGYFHVAIFFHELFHAFQLLKNNNQFLGDFGQQDFLGYPLTSESLPLLLLLFDTMIDAYHQSAGDQKKQFLSYYVAIQSELEKIDTSANSLIRTHGFYLEKLEGTARYVEVFGTLNSIDNNTIEDPTHGFNDFANSITSSLEVRQVYARRIFYHTGAGAVYLLKELGLSNVEDLMLIPENTPYDVAANFLNLTSEESNDLLEEVKARYNWEDLLERSQFLLGLQ